MALMEEKLKSCLINNHVQPNTDAFTLKSDQIEIVGTNKRD